MLFRLQRKQSVLHRVAQPEYRFRPQHPGRTQRMAPPCGRPPFFVARSEADDCFLARARVRRFSFFSFTPSPLCRKSQIDSAISVKTFGPNASPAGEAHDRTQVHPNLHP